MAQNINLQVLREPLVQFLAIGVLLFTVDRAVFLQRDDPYEIIVDERELNRLVELFTEGQGQPPSEEEVENLLVKWTQNEIFYREALAMGLDQGDEMMRSRLILKMRNVIFNRVLKDPPKDEELREWFEINRASYDEPERFSVERLRLPDASTIEAAQALGTAFAQAVPEERRSAIVRYFRRSHDNLVTLFPADSVSALLAAPSGEWVPVLMGDDWNLLRVADVLEAAPASFDEVKTQVAKDFAKAASGMQVSEMAEEIASKYRISLEFGEDDVQEILAAAINYEPAEVTAQSRTVKARAGVAGADRD